MSKIGFPMPTAKNRFQILVLHLKKHIIIEKTPFFGCTFTGPLNIYLNRLYRK